jgi:hypothetical protein
VLFSTDGLFGVVQSTVCRPFLGLWHGRPGGEVQSTACRPFFGALARSPRRGEPAVFVACDEGGTRLCESQLAPA